jgi:hypothetical protein
VRADANPTIVRQLDCQFQLAEAIHINREDFHKLTTGELLEALQSQVDEQLAKMKAAGKQACEDKLTLEVVGKKPDLKCFVDAPFMKELAESDNLEKTLSGLGGLNLFTASHVPPKITLTFARKCQFSTPPYLYGTHR